MFKKNKYTTLQMFFLHFALNNDIVRNIKMSKNRKEENDGTI